MPEPGGELRCPGDDVPAEDGRCPKCGADLRALAAVQSLAERMYWSGVELARGGRLREAVERLASALGLDPKMTRARLALGKVYARLGMKREAKDALESVLAEEPDNEQARVALQAVGRSLVRVIGVAATGMVVGVVVVATVLALGLRSGDGESADVAGARGALSESQALAGLEVEVAEDGAKMLVTGAVANETQRELVLSLLRPYADAVDDSGLVTEGESPVGPAVDLPGARASVGESDALASAEIELSASGGILVVTGAVADGTQRELLLALLRPHAGEIDATSLSSGEGSSLDLAAAVQAALGEDAPTGSVEVAVSQKGQGVQLSGTVENEDQRAAVIRVARGTPGVLLVDAEDLQVASEFPTTYVVRPGDSLASIAVRFYGDESQWREIFRANQDLLTSADLIYPGDRLSLPAPP